MAELQLVLERAVRRHEPRHVLARLKRSDGQHEPRSGKRRGLCAGELTGIRRRGTQVRNDRAGAARREARCEHVRGRSRDRQQCCGAPHGGAERHALDDRRAPVRMHARIERHEVIDDRHRRDAQEPQREVGVGRQEHVARAVGRACRQQVPPGVAGGDCVPGEALVELHVLPGLACVEDVAVAVIRARGKRAEQLADDSAAPRLDLGRGARVDPDRQGPRRADRAAHVRRRAA